MDEYLKLGATLLERFSNATEGVENFRNQGTLNKATAECCLFLMSAITIIHTGFKLTRRVEYSTNVYSGFVRSGCVEIVTVAKNFVHAKAKSLIRPFCETRTLPISEPCAPAESKPRAMTEFGVWTKSGSGPWTKMTPTSLNHFWFSLTFPSIAPFVILMMFTEKKLWIHDAIWIPFGVLFLGPFLANLLRRLFCGWPRYDLTYVLLFGRPFIRYDPYETIGLHVAAFISAWCVVTRNWIVVDLCVLTAFYVLIEVCSFFFNSVAVFSLFSSAIYAVWIFSDIYSTREENLGGQEPKTRILDYLLFPTDFLKKGI